MSGRKSKKLGKINHPFGRVSAKEKESRRAIDFENLRDLFPNIAMDVIDLMLDSCNGNVDDAITFLSDMDHQRRQEQTPQPESVSEDSGTVLSSDISDDKSLIMDDKNERQAENRLSALVYQFHPQLTPLMETHLDPNPEPIKRPASPLICCMEKVVEKGVGIGLPKRSSDLHPDLGYPLSWMEPPHNPKERDEMKSDPRSIGPSSSWNHRTDGISRCYSNPEKSYTTPSFAYDIADLSSVSDGLSSGVSSSNSKSASRLDYADGPEIADKPGDTDNDIDFGQTAPISLQLDKDTAYRLMVTFGLMQVPININDDSNLTVNLDMNMAYKLYQCWKNTQESFANQNGMGGETEDARLYRYENGMQDMEHENYAEDGLKNLSMREIMDETYALRLAERESEERGLDVGSALQYQSSDGVESKWVNVLLKSHNFPSESAFPALDSRPKDVHAVNPRRVSSMEGPPGSAKLVSPIPKRSVSDGQGPAKLLQVKPVPSATAVGGDPRSEPVDYFGIRREALDLQRKAIAYGEKAGKAFTNKKLGGGAAAYYLQRSHEHKALAKEAHLEASEYILASRNINATDGEIDLHGLRYDEVNLALDGFFARKHKQKELKIISGRGVHSRTGTSEVRRSVEIYLKKNGYSFEEGPPAGVFYVDKWQKLHARPP